MEDGSVGTGRVPTARCARATETTRGSAVINDVVGVLADEAASAKSQVALRTSSTSALQSSRRCGAQRRAARRRDEAPEVTWTPSGKSRGLVGEISATHWIVSAWHMRDGRGVAPCDEIKFYGRSRAGLPRDVRRQCSAAAQHKTGAAAHRDRHQPQLARPRRRALESDQLRSRYDLPLRRTPAVSTNAGRLPGCVRQHDAFGR